MNRQEILELVDSATLYAIKTLTTKKSLRKSKFFEIEDVPVNFSIHKIISFLRSQGNLNFIFFIHKRILKNNDRCNWIIGCRNSTEFDSFFGQFKEFSIEGCTFSIKPARKDMDVRFANLSTPPFKLIKLNSSKEYNKFFPTERMMEILVECDTSSITNSVEGIFLIYKHAVKMLNDEVYISTRDSTDSSNLIQSLRNMGNTEVSLKDFGMFLVDKSIWARNMVTSNSNSDEFIYSVNTRVLDKNILTNNLDINNIRNSLL